MEDEESYGELDPEVTKIAALLFKGGRDLARLVDPALRVGPTTAIQINNGVGPGGGGGAAAIASPQQVIAGIVTELEARGVRREDITPEMIQGLLTEMAGQPATKAIEAQVVSSGADEQ
jgi:hypothetical protein